MRPWTLLLPLAALTIACSARSESGEEMGSSTSNVTESDCTLSRSTILATAMPKRRVALERGFSWLDQNVPYSQSASHEGYRTDCSGFVSMCWDLGESSNSAAFYDGDSNTRLGGYDDLIAADALVRQGHVLMFVGWNDEAHTGMCVLEQSSTKNDMQFRVRTTASMQSQGYKAIRAKKLADETQLGEGSGTDSTDSTDKDQVETDPLCDRPIAEVCLEAKSLFGVGCGRILDDCNRELDCSQLNAFKCAPTEQCVDNTCVCVPKKISACGDGCGKIDDGCGATIDCGACETDEPEDKPDTKPTPKPEDDEDKVDPSTVGDPGDDGDSTPTSKSENDAKKPDTKAMASSGCSASPRQSGGGADWGMMPLVGLAIAAGVRRRRR